MVFTRARERERNGGGESGSNKEQVTGGRADGWVDGWIRRRVDTCRVADAFGFEARGRWAELVAVDNIHILLYIVSQTDKAASASNVQSVRLEFPSILGKRNRDGVIT